MCGLTTGLDVIHERLRPLLGEQLGAWELSADFQYAACPTPTGSLLLARAGHNTVVYQRQNLRSALGRLPATVLEVDPEQQRRLHNMGVRYLRDIWRLPTDGLRKRFGSEFVNQINRAVGKRPEPLKYYQPPPVFRSKYELPCSVENLELLMPVVDEIIAQLMDFLTRRDLSVSQLLLSLHHEQQDTTEITLGLRQPSRSPRHLMLLLETHLNNTVLPAPVENVTVEVKQFDACQGQTGSLLNDGISVPTTSRDYSFSRFMEQMQARLGQHHLQSISCVAEHCPEYASRQQDSQDQPPKRSKAIAVTDRPRPFWLLPTPRQLVVRNGRLYHRRSLRILSGPERIETRWWSGMDIRRDYYVAMEENGCRLWIYHDKTAGRHWYLHGVFA